MLVSTRLLVNVVALASGLTLAMNSGVATAAQTPPVSGAVTSAWSWITSMLDSTADVTTDSVITPDAPYDPAYTGPMSGSFELSGFVAEPIEPATVLVQGSAESLSASGFRGVVSGNVTLTPTAWRWIIQVYRVHDGAATQVPLQTLVQPDGTFSVDLGAVANPGPGTWALGVLDAFAGYGPTGRSWPTPGEYAGLEVVSYSTTDRTYEIARTPATEDGRFAFPYGAPGAKSFQLVDTIGDQVLAEYRPATGLVRSYGDGTDVAGRTFTYDQALAVQTALVMDDAPLARTLVTGLLGLQTATGAFITSAPQFNPAGGQLLSYTGNHAVALYALLSYLRYPAADPQLVPTVQAAAWSALTWLEAQRLADGQRAGLYTAGRGAHSTVLNAWDPSARLDWASAEHNLDVWQALHLAGQVLGCTDCDVRAEQLKGSLLQVMWNEQNTRFDQGALADGRDTVDPLDANSWGAIFLAEVGENSKAAIAVANTAGFAVSDGGGSGYLAYRAQPGLPSPVTSVWLEGSFGVALAQARLGNSAASQATIAALLPLQQGDGSFPMATAADPFPDLTTASSVAATAWFILASDPANPNSLWN